MTTQDDPSASKGQSLIAAYRAARLTQRPALRTALRAPYVQMRQTRRARLYGTAGEAAPAIVNPVETEIVVPPAPAPEGGSSVFAELVSQAAAQTMPELAPPARITAPESVSTELADDAPAAPTAAPVSSVTSDLHAHTTKAEATALPIDPPLAEIGFGPGMLIRLGQLGLNTIGDLAQTDAMELRASLGAISRLLDVETWISHARQAVASQPGSPPSDAPRVSAQ